MPSFSWISRVRGSSELATLTLVAQHNLTTRDSSQTIQKPRKQQIPDDIDILLSQELHISISAIVNRKKVPSDVVIKSEMTRHLAAYFQANSDGLGLESVSTHYKDETATVIVLSSRCIKFEHLDVHAHLTAIDLNYIWQTTEDEDKFVLDTQLPFRVLLNDVVDRFVTHHLVRRYPLVFGSWYKQFDIENALIPKLFKSIISIICRSENAEFRERCRSIFKRLRKQQRNRHSSALYSLSVYLNDIHSEEVPKYTDKEAFQSALEDIYKRRIGKSRFKGVSVVPEDSPDQEGDDQLLENHDFEVGRDREDIVWIDEPQYAHLTRIEFPEISSRLRSRLDATDDNDTTRRSHCSFVPEEDLWDDRPQMLAQFCKSTPGIMISNGNNNNNNNARIHEDEFFAGQTRDLWSEGTHLESQKNPIVNIDNTLYLLERFSQVGSYSSKSVADVVSKYDHQLPSSQIASGDQYIEFLRSIDEDVWNEESQSSTSFSMGNHVYSSPNVLDTNAHESDTLSHSDDSDPIVDPQSSLTLEASITSPFPSTSQYHSSTQTPGYTQNRDSDIEMFYSDGTGWEMGLDDNHHKAFEFMLAMNATIAEDIDDDILVDGNDLQSLSDSSEIDLLPEDDDDFPVYDRDSHLDHILTLELDLDQVSILEQQTQREKCQGKFESNITEFVEDLDEPIWDGMQ